MKLPMSAEQMSRTRGRERTLSELRAALARLQDGGCKLSLSAVAKEAGVTPALIHNRYPDFGEEIRGLIGKETRAQAEVIRKLLRVEREKNRLLREQLADRQREIVKLASVNEALRVEISLQRGVLAGTISCLK